MEGSRNWGSNQMLKSFYERETPVTKSEAAFEVPRSDLAHSDADAIGVGEPTPMGAEAVRAQPHRIWLGGIAPALSWLWYAARTNTAAANLASACAPDAADAVGARPSQQNQMQQTRCRRTSASSASSA